MMKKPQFRQLSIDDLEMLEKWFPQPESISHKERLQIQSPVGRSIYGFFLAPDLVALGQIKRTTTPGEVFTFIQNPEICSIYVTPSSRGKGLAYSMILQLEAIITTQGYEYAYLTVAKDNEAARALYEKLGYHLSVKNSQKNSDSTVKLYYTKKL